MKNLLIITQKVDEADDLLGFFVTWIAEFAKHFDEVHVITLATGHYQLPANVHVHSLGKERGVSKIRQAWTALGLLWHLTGICDSVFAHMSPIFAIIAWPFAFIRGRRLVLWYLHRSNTFKLRLALLLVHRLVTADAKSLTIRSEKIISVGHGIDVSRFAVARDWAALSGRPLRILSVGRLSPIKDFGTLIRAAALLWDREVSVEVRIVGRAVMVNDSAYQKELHELVTRLGVQDIVHFTGLVPYKDIAQQYLWADIVVGCTPPGGIDKVLLEAMAAGCPVLTSNRVMHSYLEPYVDQLLFQHGNSEDLAMKIDGLNDYASIGAGMVANVRRDHDVSATITKISELL